MEEHMATDDVQEAIKAQWYREDLMGRIANKLKEIVTPRGEKIWLFYDPVTRNYDNEIEYKGRKLSVWAVYPYSEVGDYDIGEPVYYTKLGDIVLFPEFRQAIEEVEKEEGIVIHPTDAIDLNDCLLAVGRSLIDYKGITRRLHLGDETDLFFKFWRGVCDDLSVFLKPEFDLHCHFAFGRVKLYIRNVYNLRRQDMIDCSPMFKEKMQKVADYCDEHFK